MTTPKKRVSEDEQMELIDVQPKNKKDIIRIARSYNRAQQARNEALTIEKREKLKLLDIVKKAKLHPDKDGNYHFRIDDVTITVTPRDELVRVKFGKEEEQR